MASPSSNKKTDNTYTILPPSSVEKKPSSHRTTYIKTDVSNFKAVVQKFTALREENPPQEQTTCKDKSLPTAYPRPTAGKPRFREMGARRPGFQLHERRQSVRVPEIKLNSNGGGVDGVGKSGRSSPSSSSSSPSSSSFSPGSSARPRRIFGFSFDKVTVSPVSPLENSARGNSRAPPRITCLAPLDEETRGIYEKGYYLHPNSDSSSGAEPPTLLPLFPIHPTGPDTDSDENEDSASSA